jgi:hypothetical protein
MNALHLNHRRSPHARKAFNACFDAYSTAGVERKAWEQHHSTKVNKTTTIRLAKPRDAQTRYVKLHLAAQALFERLVAQ